MARTAVDRTAGDPRRRFRVADLVVDAGPQTVTRDGVPLPVTGLSFDFLLALCRAAPDMLTHDQLMERVWRDAVVSPETIGQRAKLLRDALGDDAQAPRYVAVVRGRGYRLVPPVTEFEPGPASLPPAEPSAPDPAPAPAPPESPRPAATPFAAVPPVAPRGRARLGIGLAALALAVLAGAAWWLRAPRPAAESVEVVAPASVAVLPFDYLAADDRERYLATGLTEAVLDRLAAAGSLRVIARTSSFAVDAHAPAAEVGRRLGVRYLVEGSVQRSGDSLRVRARVVDAQGDRELRSVTLDRPLAGLFALQDELARQVAATFDVTLRAPVPGTASLDAQLEYYQGLEALGRWRVAELEAAIGHFRAARGLDARFAAAYVGEVLARLRITSLTGRPDAREPALRALVDQGLALDPAAGRAYVARAALSSSSAEESRDLERAVQLAPGEPEAWAALGEFLLDTNVVRGLECMDRAIALDPLQPRYRYVRALLAFDHDGDAAALEAGLLDVLRVDPKYTQALKQLAMMKAVSGRLAEGIALGERALATDPESRPARYTLFDMYVALGDATAAQTLLPPSERTAGPELALALARGEPARAWALAGDVRPSADPGWHASIDDSLIARFGWLFAPRPGDPRAKLAAVEAFRRDVCTDATGHCGPVIEAVSDVELGVARRAAGDRSGAAAALEAGLAAGNRPVRGYLGVAGPLVRALAYAALDRREEALRALAQVGAGQLLIAPTVIEHASAFAGLRGDPAFQALLAAHLRALASQRVALDGLRAAGRVPRRGGGA
jgi:TolB-like protein/DNA-binding winged helix-turn-helix (wHTH) protein